MEQFIKATPQNKKDLMAEFDTSLETVSRALNFETDSYLAKQIRTRALQMGCGVIVKLQAKKCSFCSNSQIAGCYFV